MQKFSSYKNNIGARATIFTKKFVNLLLIGSIAFGSGIMINGCGGKKEREITTLPAAGTPIGQDSASIERKKLFAYSALDKILKSDKLTNEKVRKILLEYTYEYEQVADCLDGLYRFNDKKINLQSIYDILNIEVENSYEILKLFTIAKNSSLLEKKTILQIKRIIKNAKEYQKECASLFANSCFMHYYKENADEIETAFKKLEKAGKSSLLADFAKPVEYQVTHEIKVNGKFVKVSPRLENLFFADIENFVKIAEYETKHEVRVMNILQNLNVVYAWTEKGKSKEITDALISVLESGKILDIWSLQNHFASPIDKYFSLYPPILTKFANSSKKTYSGSFFKNIEEFCDSVKYNEYSLNPKKSINEFLNKAKQ